MVLKEGISSSDELENQLIQKIRNDIGAIASPKQIYFVSKLPKTRSGKIMRRILRKIAEGDDQNLGDTSTLLNPEIVDELRNCLLYTSPSPRDVEESRMPSSA